MGSRTPDHRQIQEAKQRFSEMIGSVIHRLIPAIKAATGSSASITWRSWSARLISTSGSCRKRTWENF